MRDIVPVIQDTPIISDEEIKILSNVEFFIVRGKAPDTHKVKLDLYKANDSEFMQYMANVTKTKKDKLLKGMASEEGWNNANRLPMRLELVKRFSKSIVSYQSSTIDKDQKKDNIIDKEFEPLTHIEFTPKKASPAKNLYTATDEEFMWYISTVTKKSKDRLLANIGIKEDWNDTNRFPLRLSIIKRFHKSIESYQKNQQKQ